MSPDERVETEPLAPRLARQIDGSGPVSVAEYMRQSNTEYYDRSDPLGTDGDFVTAPEISQMFGEMIGMWLTDLWLRANSPANCHYVELGPGRGTLAADALRAMSRFDWSPTPHFVETSRALRHRQAQAVSDAHFHESIDSLPGDAPLLIVANEFFDALPVRQLVATEEGWRERFITYDGERFTPTLGIHAVDSSVPETLRDADAGSIYEIAPDAASILFGLCGRLKRQGGALLIVDYGYTGPALGDTLQALRNHEFADPFAHPGLQDLTAHVDFHPLANIALSQGLQVSGPIGQGIWLQALGIDHRTLALAQKSPGHAEALMTARNRLVAHDQMGNLFKAMAITAPEWPVPEGFPGPAQPTQAAI